MPKETEFAMTKWNGTVPQIHVPDITTLPVVEHHMTTGMAAMSITMIVIMFVVSFMFWYGSLLSEVRLHRTLYALAGLFSSFVAGSLVSTTIINW